MNFKLIKQTWFCHKFRFKWVLWSKLPCLLQYDQFLCWKTSSFLSWGSYRAFGKYKPFSLPVWSHGHLFNHQKCRFIIRSFCTYVVVGKGGNRLTGILLQKNGWQNIYISSRSLHRSPTIVVYIQSFFTR
jgi:hypothetical protein